MKSWLYKNHDFIIIPFLVIYNRGTLRGYVSFEISKRCKP